MSQITECLLPTGDPAQKIADEILNRPAIIFAGQGAQQPGMGKDLAESDKDAMELWKKAEKISGLPLREIYWDGNEDEMSNTAALQPALTVVNLNLWQAMQNRHDLHPAACAGHSLGEFCALAAAKAITPESAIEITSLRGKLMSQADPDGNGRMAAIVKLPYEKVVEIVDETAKESSELIIAANFNTPLQTVISGAKNAVGLACKKAKQASGRAMELKVSGAFHSPMMEEANRELLPLLQKTEWKDPVIPVYSNVDGLAQNNAEHVKKNIFRQMISPVFWVNLVRNLYLAGIRWWMEISPRAVLGKMIGPSLAGIASHCDSLRVDLINSLNSVLSYTF